MTEYIERKTFRKNLIDRQITTNFFRPLERHEDGCIIEMLDEAPAADVAPVMHGRWILEKEPDGKPYCFHCSVCDDEFQRIDITTKYPYCPNCGAKMEVEVHGND